VLTVNSGEYASVEAASQHEGSMMRRVSLVVPGMVVAFWISGCATERLDRAAPSGVNLTGEWKLNPNLSDDPSKLGPDPDKTPQRTPGSHRGHGGGRGGGGMTPMGSPGGFLPVALTTAPGLEQSQPLPSGNTPAPASGPPANSRGASINRFLQAPLRMSITQKDSSVLIKTNMADGAQTSDEYTAGTKTTIAYGKDNTATRSVGWRGPVFVVTTDVKKGGHREDDFAMDEDGRLIMTTDSKGGRLGTVEIKRVYDRLRGAAQ
jgi:hypothetical protein